MLQARKQDMRSPAEASCTSDLRHRALEALVEERVPFLVGGMYGVQQFVTLSRRTKDLDVFVRPADCPRVLAVLSAVGFEAALVFRHWLGKAISGDAVVDVIFSSGNGIARVDDGWFAHATAGEVLDIPVRICPVEEIIWSKAFVMERERYDGADVAHLIRARGRVLDWPRLLDRFGSHWPVLLSHLVLYRYIYPSEADAVPGAVLAELSRRAEADDGSTRERICRGTLLSRAQYLDDLSREDFRDARLQPLGTMSPEEVAAWTAPIFESR